jgi:RuvB-like protein 2
MLDIECFSFLNRAMENDMAPIIIMASNRGHSTIRGTNQKRFVKMKVAGSLTRCSPHGIPMDLLDRLLIIPTEAYSTEDLKKIIKIRLDEECVEVEPVVEEILGKICQTTSLRHTIHLISAADLVCQLLKYFVDNF